MSNKALAVGDRCPEFSLPSQHGVPVSLQTLLSKGPVVLFFYPKDNTKICTQEVCGFRDTYAAFVAAGATVVGVSSDDAASHRQFAEAQGLQYLLLSDQKGALRQRLGVPKTLGLLPGRVTYVIDRGGIVQLAYASQLAAQAHVDQALATVRRLTTPPAS